MTIRVYGIVQGVGFRPFVSLLARRMGVRGSVCNKGSHVEIVAQATASVMDAFLASLAEEAPPRAVVLRIKTWPCEAFPEEDREPFRIVQSRREEGLVFVSPDIATCPDCARELFDPQDRRFLHPFINCTACGPRLTILDAMPYDRERTSMGDFPMCEDCAAEYDASESRRYHAQPVCCNECGPSLYLLGRKERGEEALRYVRALLREGGIVAIKGIGGFHLCCDATNEAAVRELRLRKKRPYKPFALMMRDEEVVSRFCVLEEGARDVLLGPQKPILLLRRRDGETPLAEAVAPGNPELGVMLPYTPLHLLLFRDENGATGSDCLVMTSGNPPSAPICMDDAEAERYLAPLADAILSHDREIRIRADDSVMAFHGGRPYMIRRSRGYAPLPIIMAEEKNGAVLGIGGELKNTFCLAAQDRCYPSPYLGDMADRRSIHALQAAVTRMERLLEIQPEIAVCDLHPGYHTSDMARILSEKEGIPLLELQHHYAHIASCLAENEYGGEVIGVAFDGTGYGTDGTIWGGEFLKADLHGFTRLGSLAPFTQVGGNAAVREGWRIAYSVLKAEYGEEARTEAVAKALLLGTEEARRGLDFLIGNGVNTVRSTSAGRLFDAASAVLGMKKENTFEGEAAMALEFAAQRAEREGNRTEAYGGKLMNIDEAEFRLCTNDLLVELAERRMAGIDAEALALFFHEALAEMVVIGCCYARTLCRLDTVALSGGVFQNRFLLRLCEDGLKREGFRVLLHSLVPPNDGGIALGQAAAGMTALEERKKEEGSCV